jgi:hypothetical protein
MKSNTTINACLTQTGIAPRNITEVVFSFNQKEKIMNNLRNFLVGLVGLLFVMQLALVSPVAAQSPKQIERERLSRVMDSNANVEEFRQELINYFTEMEDTMRLFNGIPAVRNKLNQAGLQPLRTIAEAKQQITAMSPENLMQMRAIYAKSPNWREASRSINSLVKPNLRQQLEAQAATKQNSEDIQPDAATTDDCAAAIAADISNTDISIAKGVDIAAEAVVEAFPTDGLTILFRLPSIAARVITQTAVLTLETLKNIKDDCTELDATAVGDIVNNAKNEIITNDNSNKTSIVTNDNTNKDTILNSLTTSTTTINNAITGAKTDIVNNDNSNKTMITTAITNAQTAVITAGDANSAAIITNDNSNKTMIVNNDNSNTATLNTNLTNAKNTIIANDNTNTTNIVNNDNANKTAIVNNDNANTLALNDLILRSQIEADLAAEPSAVKVAWYMTPTANGGKLDLVQQIVTLTLANIQAAGGSIGNAQSFLNTANQDKAAGNFKSAYDNYRKAYKAAAN